MNRKSTAIVSSRVLTHYDLEAIITSKAIHGIGVIAVIVPLVFWDEQLEVFVSSMQYRLNDRFAVRLKTGLIRFIKLDI